MKRKPKTVLILIVAMMLGMGISKDNVILANGNEVPVIVENSETSQKIVEGEAQKEDSEKQENEKKLVENKTKIETKEETKKLEEKETPVADTVTLDLADGTIYIEEDGYRRGSGGVLIPFAGSYIITGTFQYKNNNVPALSVSGGTEENPINVTLKNAAIDATNEANVSSNSAAVTIGRSAVYNVADEGHVYLKLEGNNILRGAGLGAGIEMNSSKEHNTRSTLVIGGDGTLEAKGGRDAAGIGGNFQSVGLIDYKITINSGNITAIGGDQGAGIGGGKNTTGGEIIINGGNITAIGGSNASGIGGGLQQAKGYYDNLADMSITLNGGTISATGGKFGAGIGTGRLDITASLIGRDEKFVTINIKGDADVTATGGERSAGIGQGLANDFVGDPNSPWIVDAINISGGNVKAIAGAGAAGIGTSNSKNTVKTIHINGGSVYAQGDYLSSGIGAGYTGTFENIRISGGRVQAIGADYAAGIGTGFQGVGGDIELLGGIIDAKSVFTTLDEEGQGSGIGSGFTSTVKSVTIGANADVTATASSYASGIGRSWFDEATPDDAFPIVIEKGAKVTAYAMGDVYAQTVLSMTDAPYMSAIDQGCIAHVKSNIAANILMGDFKDVLNADSEQNVVISSLKNRNQDKTIDLPAGYASFATTVQQGNNRVKVEDQIYAGDLVKRNEDNLIINMGGESEKLYAYWMLQPVTIQEYTVNFEFVSIDNPDGILVPNAITVEEGNAITEPQITEPENWTFIGWYTDKDLKIPWNFATDKVVSNMTLYASWKKADPAVDIYNVTFEFNGGTFKGQVNPEFEVSIFSDSSRLITVYPYDTFVTKEGYTFKGWYSDKECTKKWDFAKDKVNGDMKLYAGWEKLNVAEKPAEPSQPNNPSTDNPSVDTGDTTKSAVYMIMLMASMIGLFVFVAKKHEKRKN